jgi:hypothetical protein
MRSLLFAVVLVFSQTETPEPTYHEDPFPTTVTSAPPVAAEIGEPAAEERLPETTMAPMDNRPCQGDNACQGRQKKGCAEATAPCSDDDKVTVVICAQPNSCRFEKEPA